MNVVYSVPFDCHHSSALALHTNLWDRHSVDTTSISNQPTVTPSMLSKRKSTTQIQPPHEPAHKKRLAYRHPRFRSSATGRSSITSATSVDRLQDNLDFLQDEWTHIDIVLNSVRNAFPVHPLSSSSEEHLDEVDRELSIAYDDLMAQVRHLDRSLRRLDTELDSLRQDRQEDRLPKSAGRDPHDSSSRISNSSPPMQK
ncbi:hypothetical protein DFQ28_006610 [Apophysomyces sp. BC1034]|nr:hypothetical protein DFQ30_003377 [Apophysomyces sp. BC1015]KAG0183005.1 hypothetical protein DFQ29_000816 [Apophysomyces sp. BC1021]KAG0194761.1 hypothetical protein DFQ28_006610 [Apophysomyces sp. BC1034]